MKKCILALLAAFAVACFVLPWLLAEDSQKQQKPGPASAPPLKVTDAGYDREKRLQELTVIQYEVAENDGTEPSFRNAYWNNKKPGLYLDIISGIPLFSSQHKYRSGTGWPSFWKPLDEEEVVEKTDHKLGYKRVEVRSKTGDTHLGHVFTDGPEPTGLRYCINSAALRFVPVIDFEKEGLSKYKALFTDNKTEAKK